MFAKFAVRIRAIQCSPSHKEEVLDFFRRLGFSAKESENGHGQSSRGKMTRIQLNSDFEPWKLKPDELKRWEKLPIVVLEKH